MSFSAMLLCVCVCVVFMWKKDTSAVLRKLFVIVNKGIFSNNTSIYLTLYVKDHINSIRDPGKVSSEYVQMANDKFLVVSV